MLLILCMLQVTLKQCTTQFPFITHGWVSQNQFFSLIYRDFFQMEMHLQKAPKKITLKLLKTRGRFFQILLCDLSFGGKDGTPSLSTTQRKVLHPSSSSLFSILLDQAPKKKKKFIVHPPKQLLSCSSSGRAGSHRLATSTGIRQVTQATPKSSR